MTNGNGHGKYLPPSERPRPMTVTLAEERMLRRIRQLAHQGAVEEVVLRLKPLSLRLLGGREILEPEPAEAAFDNLP